MVLPAGPVARAAGTADASPWDGDARTAARLIAGSPASSPGPLRAGIAIRIKPGWHTYWRYPGDAGVPPRFDFGGSQNLAEARVLWPAPERLSEDGLITIGYDRDVILPLKVRPKDPAKPVVLRLKLDYAICEKLCVPASATAALTLAGSPSAQDAALAAAEARVPRKLALGQAGPLSVRTTARQDDGGAHPRILVDLVRPTGETVALFAEGPTPEWALPVPAPVEGAPEGLQRFAFELDGAPPGASYKGALITLTAVTDHDAIEVPFRLD